jgi:membrane-associated phospholipid phosphatase
MNSRLSKNYFIAFVTSIIVFIGILLGVILNKIYFLDSYVHSYLLFWSSSDVARAASIFTHLADTLVIVVAVVLLCSLLLIKKRHSELLFVLFTSVSGFIVASSLKLLVHRVRPTGVLFTETGFSFPSGHAFKAMLFVLILWFVIVNNWKSKLLKNGFYLFASLFVILMEFSRLVMGVHWFSDVLGGFVLGIFWFSLCVLVFERFG